MPHLAYVNGHYAPHQMASLSIEDRATQFSDGVYEVCLYLNGHGVDFTAHMDRLDRSLAALSIPAPMGRRAMALVMDRLLIRNRLRTASLYLQISRGVAPRDHAFPKPAPAPSLIMTAKRFDCAALKRQQAKGIAVISTPDLRWKRCDIKSVSLLGNVLAKQAARQKGAGEGWMVDADGLITEGASSSAFIIDQAGCLRIRELAADILPSITRQAVLDIAAQQKITIDHRAFSLDEAKSAKEAFIASTTAGVTPVISLDDQMIGHGQPGPITQAIISRHWDHMQAFFDQPARAPSASRMAQSPAR
ncbi:MULTISPECIES: D-amino-acid transaminase [unclassified Iodidimonas]|uniref:D-amino-acid transaminase n=1 Tax=unclassified Iodidimonas TaxID=2626145 RepID=UPI00248328A5|nr:MULTISPECIES: D-amino-acid transaminase [unclassified Iodidimonas]